MTFEIRLRRANHGRKFGKFRRCVLKDSDATNRDIKAQEFEKHYVTLEWNGIKKFLMRNVGKPLDYVYSEFLKRWECPKYSPLKEFNNVMKFCDFTVDEEGILIYKGKPKVYEGESREDYLKINQERWVKINLYKLVKRLSETKTAQCLGKFYVDKDRKVKEETIYMDYYNPIVYEVEQLKPKKYHRVKTCILSVGYGLNYSEVETQTGKVKRYYEMVSSPYDAMVIYFYYRN